MLAWADIGCFPHWLRVAPLSPMPGAHPSWGSSVCPTTKMLMRNPANCYTTLFSRFCLCYWVTLDLTQVAVEKCLDKGLHTKHRGGQAFWTLAFRTRGVFKTMKLLPCIFQNTAIVRTVYPRIIQPYSGLFRALCLHSEKTKTLCCHGSCLLYIYCFRLSEASSFRRIKFCMRNKLNDVQKENFHGYTFILQVTKPIFKSIPEHSEH